MVQIGLYFNSFLPTGKKKRVFENIKGAIIPTNTKKLERGSIRVGELDRDSTAFMSESYEEEIDERTKALLNYLKTNRKPKEQQELPFTDPTGLLGKHREYVHPLVEGDVRPPYIVNTSVFKTPQSTVLVSHYPEKKFVFSLFEHWEYLDSWIKSPDKGFYSIDYEYWKGGKDRVRKGFNPDFFIKIDLDNYIAKLSKKGSLQNLEALKELQDKGYESIIRVVEIKSDDDDDEATPAKDSWAKAHFEALNEKLMEPLPGNFDKEYKPDISQFYTFDLLKPAGYIAWFKNIENGNMEV